jgi:hypothetical protein
MFSLTPATLRAVQTTLSPARLARYLPAAGGNADLALRLYLWNARICEAFYLPCQIAEVACRNVIARALADRYGMHWYNHEPFLSILPNRLRDEVDKVVGHERARHGVSLTMDHVISNLTFGFWVHLLTKGFDFILWKRGMSPYFRHAPAGMARLDLHQRVDRVRMFRNRIAHHEAVFDKRPMAEHNNIFLVVGWICVETQWLLAQLAGVARTINSRPRG